MDFSFIFFSSKPFGTCFLIFFLGLLEILVDPKILTFFVNASGKYAFVVRHFDIRYVLPLRNGGSVRPFNTYCWFHDPLARHGIYISHKVTLYECNTNHGTSSKNCLAGLFLWYNYNSKHDSMVYDDRDVACFHNKSSTKCYHRFTPALTCEYSLFHRIWPWRKLLLETPGFHWTIIL